MFNKPKSPPQTPEKMAKPSTPPAPESASAVQAQPKKSTFAPSIPANRAASVLFNNLTINGNIVGSGDLQLEGTVHGDVRAGQLTVGESGNIEGKVEADFIEIRGRIVGTIVGKNVKLTSTAYVEGDITHDQLSIDVGAYFQGRCLQTRKAESAVAAPSAYANGNNGIATVPPLTPTAPPPASFGAYDMSALSDIKPN